MAGTLTVSGMSAGELTGERIIGPLTIVGKAVIGETIVASLASGDNRFVVPSEAVAVMIVPPPNNETSITLRTSVNEEDSGLPLNPSASPFVYPLVEHSPLSLIVHSASATTGLYILFI